MVPVVTSNWTEHGHIRCLKERALYSISPLLLKARLLADFKTQKKDQLVTVAQMEEIPVALILNWDQTAETGYWFVPSPSSIMDKKGMKRGEMVGQSEKRQISAVLCGSLEDDFLPIFN